MSTAWPVTLSTLLTCLALALVACTQPATPTPAGARAGETPPGAQKPGAAEGSPSTPSGPAAKPSGPAQAALHGDQTLRINIGSEPATIDPTLASFVDEAAIAQLVHAPLMSFDTRLQVVPGAAEKYTVSNDGLTYAFALRQGLTFSDGQPVKAQHYEYAWKRLLDPALAAEYASIAYVIKGAEEYNTADHRRLSAQQLQALRDAVGVKATDDSTLVFTLKHPAPYFVSITALWFSVPLREDLIKKGGERWTEPETYAGSGPFVLKDWQHQNKLVFEANPRYYRGKPRLERIEAVMINDPTVQRAAYLNGELDLYEVGGEDLATVERDPSLSKELLRWPGTCTYYIGFNAVRPPFDNLKVRQAFAATIDREAYVRDIGRGLGKAAYSFVPPGLPGYQPALKQWTFSPQDGRRLLGDAGFADPTKLPPITITYSSNPRTKARMEWLADQWKRALGVEVKLDPVETKAYTELLKKPETTPQVFLLGWCADYPDPQNWLSVVFHSKSTIARTGWKNADFDALLDQADRLPDMNKRLELYNKAQGILVEQAPVAFLLHSEHVFLKKTWVRDLHVSPIDSLPGIFGIEKTWIAKH
ncbi:MAG: peptide ABC transporter substrate-binding protein [Chloroflexi bacterium]|nr:peptide ABC transporter substrate-binding protein [Chloroflexota bacterium]